MRAEGGSYRGWETKPREHEVGRRVQPRRRRIGHHLVSRRRKAGELCLPRRLGATVCQSLAGLHARCALPDPAIAPHRRPFWQAFTLVSNEAETLLRLHIVCNVQFAPGVSPPSRSNCPFDSELPYRHSETSSSRSKLQGTQSSDA